LSALSHRTEFLLCAKSPGNKKPEKVKFPRSRQLSPLASAASHPMNRAETICHPPENGILLKSYCTFRPIFAELYNKFKYFLFSRCYKLFYLYVLTYCFYHWITPFFLTQSQIYQQREKKRGKGWHLSDFNVILIKNYYWMNLL